MSQESNLEKLTIGELARKVQGDLIPLNNRFSYFAAAVPLSEDDVQEYIREPIVALPPTLLEALPTVAIVLAPYMERVTRQTDNREKVEDYACFAEPEASRRIWSSKLSAGEGVVMAFGMREHSVGDFHYAFYHLLADVVVDRSGLTARDEFQGVLRDELGSGVHGEVDEQSWQMKQALLRKQRNMRRQTKGFAAYARQALLDTLTLYLHGICCDIDVETGPRQIASRHLRRRLELLQSVYPPPDGYAVFPEELNHTK